MLTPYNKPELHSILHANLPKQVTPRQIFARARITPTVCNKTNIQLTEPAHPRHA